jgi:hypothetical protein
LVFFCFGSLVAAHEQRRKGWYLLAVAAAGCAIAMRYAALPLLAAALFVILVARTPKRTRPFTLLVALVMVFTLAALFTFRPAWLAEKCVDTPMEHWSGANLFRSEHHSDDGELSYRFPNIAYALSIVVHPGFVPMAVLLLPFARWRDLSGHAPRLAVGMLATYLVFTAGLPFQNDRVMLMALPFIAFLVHPAFGRAWSWVATKGLPPVWPTAGMAIVQLGLFARAMWPFVEQARVERELTALLREVDATHVYTHGLGPMLSNCCPEMMVTEMWYDRIDRFRSGAIVLVNAPNLQVQWQGLHPWENWERVRAQGVQPLAERKDGWVMARVR